MQLELAEDNLLSRRGFEYRPFVHGYSRKANYVPGYNRRAPLRDSSLMTFKLADGRIVQLPPHKVSPGYMPSASGCNCANGRGYWTTGSDGGALCVIDRNACGGSLMDSSGYLFITVPDPTNRQAPRQVREDMFDELPASEFNKLIAYVQPFNSPETLQAVIDNRNAQGLNDSELLSDLPSAAAIVKSVYATSVPSPIMPTATSIWDETILGVPVKYAAMAVGAWFLLK